MTSGPFVGWVKAKGHAESAWRRKKKQRQTVSTTHRDELSFGSELEGSLSHSPPLPRPSHTSPTPKASHPTTLEPHLGCDLRPPRLFPLPPPTVSALDAVACVCAPTRPPASPLSTIHTLLCEAAARCPTEAVASRACVVHRGRSSRERRFFPRLLLT
jgi:hypothetical protein